MLTRFSLYGFLKNQRYFEPFLVLAFLEVGLSYAQIGLLIGARELTVALLEVGSGAFADVYGRRRSMVLSFSAYIVSFVVFATSESFWLFLPAMILLCLGLPVIWGERRWGLIVPFAILFPAAIYGLFAVVLGVHFDPGPLAFW